MKLKSGHFGYGESEYCHKFVYFIFNTVILRTKICVPTNGAGFKNYIIFFKVTQPCKDEIELA